MGYVNSLTFLNHLMTIQFDPVIEKKQVSTHIDDRMLQAQN